MLWRPGPGSRPNIHRKGTARNRAYRHLFIAPVFALLQTGMVAVVLGLLAQDLTGASAGEIPSAVLPIEMMAYIGVAPFASA